MANDRLLLEDGVSLLLLENGVDHLLLEAGGPNFSAKTTKGIWITLVSTITCFVLFFLKGKP